MPSQNIRTLPRGQSPNPATTCYAEKTFHHFCSHITTTYTQHSPLCTASQNQDAPSKTQPTSSSKTRPRSSTLTQTLTRTVSESANSAVEALGGLARRFTVQSTESRVIPITSLEFSFAARVPCLQVVEEPLYDPAPCKRCAKSMGLGLGKEGSAESERVMTEREEVEWVRRRVKLEADMRE